MIDLIIAIASGSLEFFISIFTYRAEANYGIFGMDPVTSQLAIGVGSKIIGSLFGRKKRRRAQKKANEDMAKYKEEYMSLETSNLYNDIENPYDNMKNPYEDMKNPYADMKNPYANMKNQFANMENPYEDLTVNLKQADFMADQQAQRDVNVLDALQGAAGGSGVAGLAQSVYGQKVKKGQQAAASIGQQESRNQSLAAQGQASIDSQERQGQMQVDMAMARGQGTIDMAMAKGQGEMQSTQMRAAGEIDMAQRRMSGAIDMQQRAGEAESRRLIQERTEALYGMSINRSAAAQEASNTASQNFIGGVGNAFSSFAGAGGTFDFKNGFQGPA